MSEKKHVCDDDGMRDGLLGQINVLNLPDGTAANALIAAAMFSLAHQVGRIATVLESISPLIELGTAEARREARG